MELEQKINRQFRKLADELDLRKSYTQERDWALIGTGLATGLLFPLAPIALPLIVAYSSKRNGDTAAGLGLAAYLAFNPLFLPLMAVQELVKPMPKNYFYLGKENNITTENHSSLPAVYFYGNPQQFYSMEIYFASGDAGIIPNPEYRKVPYLGNGQRALNKNKYDQAGYFLNISAEVNEEMNRLLEERAGRLIK